MPAGESPASRGARRVAYFGIRTGEHGQARELAHVLAGDFLETDPGEAPEDGTGVQGPGRGGEVQAL